MQATLLRFNNASCLTATTLLLMFVAMPANAGMDDRFRLTAGSLSVFRYASTTSLTSADVGLGIAFSPEDSLGWDSDQTVFRLDGRYRFNPAHSLNFSWYRISVDGTRSLTDEIGWIDREGNPITIPIGASVSSGLNYDIVKLSYLWTYYSNEKLELTAGAGLHVTRLAVDIEAETTSSGIGAEKADSTLPLPVLAVGLDYNVTSKFSWYLKSEMFSISLGDWHGVYSDTQLGAEYRAFEKIGFGIGIGTSSLDIDEDNGRARFKYDNRLSGLYLFVSGYF